MGFTTILLITVAVAIVFIMLRVSGSSREAVQAEAAVHHVHQDGQAPAELRSHTDGGQADEGSGRNRHGCC
jgi:hypothetical protein